jgi:hypothetical protein
MKTISILLSSWAGYALAQAAPVSVPSAPAVDWWIVVPVLLVIFVAAGYLWLKHSHPTTALALATNLHADATESLHEAVTELSKAVAALNAKLNPAPAAVAPAAPAAPAGPTPEQVAAVAAAEAALANAKKAAGM